MLPSFRYRPAPLAILMIILSLVAAIGGVLAAVAGGYQGYLNRRAIIELQRAWIYPHLIGVRDPLTSQETSIVEIRYTNIGHSPAVIKRARVDYGYAFIPPEIWEISRIGPRIRENDACTEKALADAQSTGAVVAYPNGDPSLLAVEFPGMPQNMNTPYIYGCIEYLTMNEIHRSEFCQVYWPNFGTTPLTYQFHFCPAGNSAD